MASHQQSTVRCPSLLLRSFGALALLNPIPAYAQDSFALRVSRLLDVVRFPKRLIVFRGEV